jgi:CHASE3 domain sensor protein
MYVDGYMLFAIYFIAVLALAVSVFALWSLEEIRKYYQKLYTKQNLNFKVSKPQDKKPARPKSHWD